jgi:pimeloyl-ACP methyl ester carboxylesterase
MWPMVKQPRPTPTVVRRRLSRAELRLSLSAPRPSDGFTSHRPRVRDIETHFRAAVTGAVSTPVVLIHGLAVSHRYLMPTALALTADHPVYVPDLPGFGLSGKPSEVYGPEKHARHLVALLERLRIGQVCLVGHSFGCEVVARLAARNPEVAKAMVLIGPSADPAARSYSGQVGRWLVDLFREDPQQARILVRDVRDAGVRRVLGTLRRSVHNAIESDLAVVRAPTLLLRGARDPIVPTAWLRQAAQICRGPTEIGEFSAAAHNVATTAGTDVGHRITRFLHDHESVPLKPR